jgi:peptidoglycan/xylan/chitin deacetylase (PgdA/CDA1 family)
MRAFVWPSDATSAASLTFDVDAESVWLAMDPGNAERPGVLSQGRYGPLVGLPLILELLADKGISATFFIPGVNVSLYPEAVEAIICGGHEVGLHGYTHTRPSLLSPEGERSELERSFDELTAAGGVVRGYRAPGWDVSAQTLDLLEAKGLLYASQFMDDIAPYRHPGRRLIELPVRSRRSGRRSSKASTGAAEARSSRCTLRSRAGRRASRSSAG